MSASVSHSGYPSQVAERLLERGARSDVVDTATGENLLHLAVNGQSAAAPKALGEGSGQQGNGCSLLTE